MNDKRLDAKTLQNVIPAELAVAKKDRTLRQRRLELLAMFGLSAVVDASLFVAELPLDATFMGIPLVVDEILEYGISFLIGRNRLKTRWYDKVIGLLPIPGVTSITVRAATELIRSFVRPTKFMEEGSGKETELISKESGYV